MNQLTLIVKLTHPDALYKCSCGVLHVARHSQVKLDRVKSCGCLRGPSAAKRNTTHGKFGTPVYNVWNSMVGRCHNPSTRAYKDYGGRGITVCAEWRRFENFYADMGEPTAGLTLDRIDNDLGYSKANCQWATMKVQQNNKRSNVRLHFEGKTLNVTQWAKLLNTPRQLIYDRLRAGWPIARALTEPHRCKR